MIAMTAHAMKWHAGAGTRRRNGRHAAPIRDEELLERVAGRTERKSPRLHSAACRTGNRRACDALGRVRRGGGSCSRCVIATGGLVEVLYQDCNTLASGRGSSCEGRGQGADRKRTRSREWWRSSGAVPRSRRALEQAGGGELTGRATHSGRTARERAPCCSVVLSPGRRLAVRPGRRLRPAGCKSNRSGILARDNRRNFRRSPPLPPARPTRRAASNGETNGVVNSMAVDFLTHQLKVYPGFGHGRRSLVKPTGMHFDGEPR